MFICFFFFEERVVLLFFFFFQAEDGIRDDLVTGVQTCALPIFASQANAHFRIVKEAARGSAKATVERVDGEELVAEIVRMLGGERDDEVASRHARDLLAAA